MVKIHEGNYYPSDKLFDMVLVYVSLYFQYKHTLGGYLHICLIQRNVTCQQKTDIAVSIIGENGVTGIASLNLDQLLLLSHFEFDALQLPQRRVLILVAHFAAVIEEGENLLALNL